MDTKTSDRLLTQDELRDSVEGWEPNYLPGIVLLVMLAQDNKTAEKVVSLIESYLVTTIESDGMPIHHIDDGEWNAVKSKILGDKTGVLPPTL